MADQNKNSKQDSNYSKSDSPSITLPKGGGALKSIDEKFSVNPSNGTAGFSVPLPITPGRNGFTPALSLSYNSGVGNSLFGLGWGVEFPAIQRKTDKQLPRYRDGIDEDVFMFSGVEDLVPFLTLNNEGNWVPLEIPLEETNGKFRIKRYRPRIEGAFSRIERITPSNSDTFYWKVTTKDNIVTYFGKSETHRIADPADPNDPSKVFKWLPECSFDDKGNLMQFEFKDEDLAGVENTLHEQNRLSGLAKISSKHLKRIKYGNRVAFYPGYVNNNTEFDEIYNTIIPATLEYFFELVFDYGEHTGNLTTETIPWNARKDAFSEYRSGFEMRTYRLCKRVLMFHHFDELLDEYGVKACLIKSLDLTYQHQPPDSDQLPEVTYLKSIAQTGYLRNKETKTYSSKSLPPMEFEYNELKWNKEIKTISSENIVNAPVGLSNNYQWTDLYNEGISGILTEQADAWYYKSNLGDGEFTTAHKVAPKPSFIGIASGALQLQDIEANGKRQIVVATQDLKGYFELDDDNEWQSFHAFDKMPTQDFRDPNVKFIDLNGDGMPELVVSEENVFTWYPAKGVHGYDPAEFTTKTFDEEQGPAIVFSDNSQSIFLADMSGDGLTDIVRIRNSDISYWPNLGYGRFGAKVKMSNAPVFDYPDKFDPSYLHLADVSGTGATDILYLGQNKFKAWLNLSGNSWSPPCEIDPFFSTEHPNQVAVVDLLGIGTSCIVWSSPLPNYATASMRYIDLMHGKKPHIMRAYKNNFGKETTIEYKSSTWYYLQDKKFGNPCITKLPFPVQCVSKVEIWERITNAKFINEYTYHHGYYDHAEREFRGFGMLEQTDTEQFDNWIRQDASNIVDEELHEPPVKTKTWFHTGAFFRNDKILKVFEEEYYHSSFEEYDLPDAVINTDLLTGDLIAIEYREALRACKGMVLRQEIYASDGSDLEDKPYSVAEHSCNISVLQPKGSNKNAVFLVLESEAITYNYERNDFDPRIAHTLNTQIDEFGNIEEAATIVYSRDDANFTSEPEPVQKEQKKMFITYTVNDYTEQIDEHHAYRLCLPAETRTFELTGFTKEAGDYFSVDEIYDAFNAPGTTTLDYELEVTDTQQEKRVIEHVRTIYRENDAVKPMPLGEIQSLALPYETYKLAYTRSLLDNIYGGKVTDEMLEKGEYRLSDDLKNDGLFPSNAKDAEWWIPSGRVEFPVDPAAHFYIPTRYLDPFGYATNVEFYSDYHLILNKITDAVGNSVTAQQFDFRMLTPIEMKDSNDNLSEVRFDMLGFVVASAVKGKVDEADDLDNFIIDLPLTDIENFFDAPATSARDLLQHASARFVYDFDRYLKSWNAQQQLDPDIRLEPVAVASILRETHFREEHGTPSRLQCSFEYSDGLGRLAMKKVQAEPGIAKQLSEFNKVIEVDTLDYLRWVGNGRTIMNNKGKPVKQYEPYFSVTHEYEDEKELVEIGVTPILFYDSVGRLIKTEFPDGTFFKVEFDSWKQITYDQVDTVLDKVKNDLGEDVLICQWYIDRKSPKPTDTEPTSKEERAAWLAAIIANTPTTVYLDALARPFLSVQFNRTFKVDDVTKKATDLRDEYYKTQTILDIEGNPRQVIDARNVQRIIDNQPFVAVMEYKYDMLGAQVYQKSMDAGEKWVFNNVMGNAGYTWDSPVIRQGITFNQRFKAEYDALHRPTKHWLAEHITESNFEKLIGLTIYGEGQLTDKAFNLRGKVYQSYDQSGRVETPLYDFKGNARSSNKKLAVEYRQLVDLNVADPSVLLETETFSSSSRFDALNRPIEMKMPDGSVVTPGYNEAGLLETLQAYLKRKDEIHHFITNIDYDAKGQRMGIIYGNNTSTSYEYDPETFRLKRLLTTRNFGANFLQDLKYTYDPAGNITDIVDNAQQTIFFNNAMVEPHGAYVYDAIYRLIKATGREHAGQNAAFDQFDLDKTTLPNGNRLTLTGDMNAMQRYDQRYEYDSVGNMVNMIHYAGNGAFQHRWTRNFECNSNNNRLIKTTVGNEITNYQFDAHGNMLNLQNESFNLTWNYADQLKEVNLGGGGTSYYIYDATGHRVRKVIENGNLVKERIYLSGYEIYREAKDTTLNLERETLHIMDDKRRIALVEHRKIGTDLGWKDLIRYQYSNHLGSAALEMSGDSTPEIISYEEYYPYGSTSYQALRNQTETPKRYRYTGKERDEETGLEDHGARYYACWLGRWVCPDPARMVDGPNVYQYSNQNPVNYVDGNGKEAWKITGYYKDNVCEYTYGDDEHSRVCSTPDNGGDSPVYDPKSAAEDRAETLKKFPGPLSNLQFNEMFFKKDVAKDMKGDKEAYLYYSDNDRRLLSEGAQVYAGGSQNTNIWTYTKGKWWLEEHLKLLRGRTKETMDMSLDAPLRVNGVNESVLQSLRPKLKIDEDRDKIMSSEQSFNLSISDIPGLSFLDPKFQGTAHYFGLQLQKLSLNVGLNPTTGNTSENTSGARYLDIINPSSRSNGGKINLFEPGISLGYTFFMKDDTSTTLLSLGISASSEVVPYTGFFPGGVSRPSIPLIEKSQGPYAGIRFSKIW